MCGKVFEHRAGRPWVESSDGEPQTDIRQEAEACPICNGDIVIRCRCVHADAVCVNGHKWWYCPICGNCILTAYQHAGDNAHKCHQIL